MNSPSKTKPPPTYSPHPHSHATHHCQTTRPNYHPSTPYRKNTNNHHHSNNNQTNPKPFKGKCHYCREIGHVTSHCPDFKRNYPNVVFPPPKPSTRFSKPQAHTATAHPSSPYSWTVDSGVSHHITNDLNMLSLHTPYNGPDDLIIGDGTSLPITHLGSFSIHSSSTSLTFTNFLIVPSISRNLFSVEIIMLKRFSHQLPFVFKALSTRETLLQGLLHEGTYEWRPSKPQAYSAKSSLMWHHRLGHPSNVTYKLSIVNSSSVLQNFLIVPRA